MRTAREKLEENGIVDEVMLVDEETFKESLIGVTMLPDLRAVYSYEKMVEEVMEKYGYQEDEAADHVSYNVVRWAGYMGDNAPIIVDLLE